MEDLKEACASSLVFTEREREKERERERERERGEGNEGPGSTDWEREVEEVMSLRKGRGRRKWRGGMEEDE